MDLKNVCFNVFAGFSSAGLDVILFVIYICMLQQSTSSTNLSSFTLNLATYEYLLKNNRFFSR